ncbi:uncharacterized protein LOC130801625 [Amaranthus tricolor]|uniref:uncharacterized protein LOC130801625 n=1 Tax=Amaranthus tricolor TaxID=29722 RepID=UPI00258C1AD6|nr:uncharacterized protein LOC130801625 [Amaranthus tricolor]
MKASHKDPEKLIWDQMRPPTSVNGVAIKGLFPKLMLWLILSVFVTYLVYTLKFISHPYKCEYSSDSHIFLSSPIQNNNGIALTKPEPESELKRIPEPEPGPTTLSHIVFGIGGSASLWEGRKNYIKIWYKKSEMRGIVWLDGDVSKGDDDEEDSLPEVRISEDTSKFRYTNKQGHRSAIRISRIISETLRLGLKNVRWFVLGDDDTVFVTENLVRVLNKYDHREYYYIGSNSESHLQNIYFSYAMAYGGGGFAISYPLAVALEKMQDRCIQRYPVLYGSDDRMQACMAELGVPLTKELGFHQYDVYGNLFGLLAAHPVTPFVTLHHLDVVEPIFPNATQVQALQRLKIPMKLDSAGLMQ